MKIITVIGARPQFIKAAVVSRLILNTPDMDEVIIHTGQHFDANMSEVFFDELNIPEPHYNLDINGLGHGAMTGQMLEKIEEILIKENPDWVLVYGDTNSTIAGALSAKKLHIKVAHIEAGLRSFNMNMPEEINRILTDRISDILFCPTDIAVKNLQKEGFEFINSLIVKTGDVMQDAAIFYANKAGKSTIKIQGKFILSTIHRAENTDDTCKLQHIFNALEEISNKIPVLLPLHPRTKKKLEDLNYDFNNSCIRFVNPVGYLEMVWLLKNCELVMTDSGGLQKESYFFGKYCVTLRDETEWVELVDNGFNILAGSDENKILNNVALMLNKDKTGFENKLYGNGDAGQKILNTILNYDSKSKITI
ncbi:MAG: UDP-N-acetylglucosamine 2-epimerase (non-hydrolyzing) [Fusobacteriaceae bacterium]|jgi:UDP-GlcNAc3NAcA epimerase|nr:UDP-N-acetylglucosamine 2-epimerase (non-hydrolyzing) [Fusobacteriaceae bacterium]